jgi:hypothetical protein
MTASIRHAIAIAVFLVPGALAAQGRAAAPTPANAIKTLDPDEMIAIAPKVRAIKAKPATLTLHVGETVSFDRFTVTVIDSSGRARGRLLGYDFAIKPGEPATAVPRQVTGVRPGTTELAIRYPRSSWKARKDPRVETTVKIVVVK